MPASVLRERSTLRRPPAGLGSVVVTVTRPPGAGEIAALAGYAQGLEIRADLVGDLDTDRLRSRFPGALTYVLRSRDRDAIPVEERHRRLLAAADHYDEVELEYERDLTPELLARIAPERRRISSHGQASGTAELMSVFERMATVPASLYLLAPRATSVAEGLSPLRLLTGLGRDDVTAFATGPTGAWTRLLAPHLGAAVVYGGLGDPEEPGVPTARQLATDYGYPALVSPRDLYGIVGGSERHSLAPRILNTAFRALGLPSLYVPFFPAEFGRFWRELVEDGLPALGLPVRGLTVVRPHKEDALTVAATTGGRAERAGAANCLVANGESWHAANTTGLIELLAGAAVDPRGLAAAVVGCGGAGRSVAAELSARGATVTLVNRGTQRGRYASCLLGLPWVALGDFSPAEYGLVVNATPLARELPFDVSALPDRAVVADLAYEAGTDTALVTAARRRGMTAVDGRQVLAAEMGSQFALLTGKPLPAEAVRVALG